MPTVVAVVCAAGALLILALMLTPSHRRGWPKALQSGAAHGFNVLLITLDTTRADHLGCYGDKAAQTPALDALAAKGLRITDAVTPVPVTLPSHTTMLTGLDPPNHGVRHNGQFTLSGDRLTLAEVLRDRGYQTAAFVSAFVLNHKFGLVQGFDVYDDNVDRTSAKTGAVLLAPIHERPAVRTTDAALRWLAGRDREKPFFCWVHYFDPHRPYQMPPPYAQRFADRPYDGEIAYVDSQVGRLMAAIRANAAGERTLTLVVADHGESLGEHGELTHAMLIYEATMHVPFLVHCPALFHESYVLDDRVVTLADLFPTVLDLLGIESGAAVDGESLVTAGPRKDRAVYMETLAPYLDSGWSPLHGLRRHHDKYVLAPTPEYYDLRSDPHELTNLYPSAAADAQAARDKLRDDLAARLEQGPTLEGVLGSITKLDPEDVKALRALGYVGTVAVEGGETSLADPKDMMVVQQAFDRANALVGAGRFEEALSLLDNAREQSPSDQKVLMMIGKVYLYMGREDDAETLLRDAIEMRPSAQISLVSAETLTDAHQFAGAARILEDARRLTPDNVDVLVALGMAYLNGGQPALAADTLREAERIDQTRVEVYINLAAALRRLGRLSDALGHADRAVALSPETAQAHLTRGLILKQMGSNEEALRALLAAAALDAHNVNVTQELANVYVRLSRYDEALDQYRVLSRLVPKRWEPHLGLGKVYLLLGRLDEAAVEARLGLQMAPNEPRLRALARRLGEQQRP